jgi:Domain of unknown function (DUF5658)
MANSKPADRPLAGDRVYRGTGPIAHPSARAAQSDPAPRAATSSVIDLREPRSTTLTKAPPAPAASPVDPETTPATSTVERRDAVQRSLFCAVVVIAILNVFDLITTYVAIAWGAHEANPIVAWMISSHVVVLAKTLVCGALIVGALMSRHRRRRVTLPSLCTAWAVVGVYSLVVLINTLTVWAHMR